MCTSQDKVDSFFTHDHTRFNDPFLVDASEFPDDLKAVAKKNSEEKQSKYSKRLKKRDIIACDGLNFEGNVATNEGFKDIREKLNSLL